MDLGGASQATRELISDYYFSFLFNLFFPWKQREAAWRILSEYMCM